MINNNKIIQKENIYNFYVNEEKDLYGRTFNDILNKNKFWLEFSHNYIQRLFPLNENSKYDKTAPILTIELIQNMKNNNIVRENMLKALDVMLRLYSIQDYPNNIKWHYWITPYNHNYKRLTRIIKSLKLIDLEEYALSLYDYLTLIYNKFPLLIGKETFEYWTNAINN